MMTGKAVVVWSPAEISLSFLQCLDQYWLKTKRAQDYLCLSSAFVWYQGFAEIWEARDFSADGPKVSCWLKMFVDSQFAVAILFESLFSVSNSSNARTWTSCCFSWSICWFMSGLIPPERISSTMSKSVFMTECRHTIILLAKESERRTMRSWKG